AGQAITAMIPALGLDVISQEMMEFSQNNVHPFEWGVYACKHAPCTPTLISASYIPWGTTSFVIDSTNFTGTGAAEPAQSYAGLTMHGGQLLTGFSHDVIRLSTGEPSEISFYWQPDAASSVETVLMCNVIKVDTYCGGIGGHPFGAIGISGFAAPGFPPGTPKSDLSLSYFTLLNNTVFQNMIPSGPQPQLSQDSHIQGPFVLDPAGLTPGVQELTLYNQDTSLISNGIDGPGNPVVTRQRFGQTESVMVSDLPCPSGPPCPTSTIWQMYDPHSLLNLANISGSPTTPEIINQEPVSETLGSYGILPTASDPLPGAVRFAIFQSNFMDRLGPQYYKQWQPSTSVSIGTIYSLPIPNTYNNATGWVVALNAGTTPATAPAFNTTLGAVTSDGVVKWEYWTGCNVGSSFPGWAASTAYATNQFIQTPQHNFVFATTAGTSGTSAPQFPEWVITSMSQSGTSGTITLSVTPTGLASGDKIVVLNTSNLQLDTGPQTGYGNNPLTYTVSSVASNVVSYTSTQTYTASATGGIMEWDGGTATDGGVTWTLWLPGAHHFAQAPFFMNGTTITPVFPFCRMDIFAVEMK
ncbi:MAG: hypothetical protein ACRD3T_14475, partial [Terriglobia bacterium]